MMVRRCTTLMYTVKLLYREMPDLIPQDLYLHPIDYRVRTDSGKYWSLKITFSRPGKSWNQA